MKDRHFTTVFAVDNTPKQAFDAINNPRAWWSGVFEGNTDEFEAEFTYRYKDLHYSKQKVTEFIPGKKVVWLVTDSRLEFIEDKSEWTGTKMCFEIARDGDKTRVRFSHLGLAPDHECFDACSSAWGALINGSLKDLIITGKAQPGLEL